MIFNIEKNILEIIKKKNITFNELKKEVELNRKDLKQILNDLTEKNIIEKNRKYFKIKDEIDLLDTDTSCLSDNEIVIKNTIFESSSEEINSSTNVDNLDNEDLNITFNRISETDDGVKFSIDKDDDNNKVVNLYLNLVLEISDKYERQYKPKELELNLKIPKSIYLLISKKLDN